LTFAAAESVADAVLYEGYVLYPYRASAIKNKFRFQFGVLAPRSPSDEGEPWFSQTDCVVEPDAEPAASAMAVKLATRARFLASRADAAGELDGWLEGKPYSLDLEPIDLGQLPMSRTMTLDGVGREIQVVVCAARVDRYITIRLRLENHEPWRPEYELNRDAMLRRSLVGTHVLLSIENGQFLSLLEPPDGAEAVVAARQNLHTWPVLVGDRAERRLMLSSPIVLYDYPAVAPESPGDLCDAAEIDEILSLRILTMTDDEKREARATDPRAGAILDRVEAMSPDTFGALHGARRSAEFFNPPGTPSPDEASVVVGTYRVAKGSRVRLRPNRRADAMDMFLAGQAATVAGVYRDLDDRVYIAVTVDADPAASLHESFGRFFYFDPSEVELVDSPMEPV